MVKRTQGLPINTIILAIIAIVVLVFLILIFTGGIGKFVSQTNQITPSSNQTINAQCSQYAAAIANQIGTSTNPSVQLQMLANSQYVSSNCSIYFQYSFSLYNGSEVICGLGQNQCIDLSGSNCSSCQPGSCIPGCQLK
jgi:predicted PurR-regulated permease PerM